MIEAVETQKRNGRTLVLAWLCNEMEAQNICGKIYRNATRVIREPSLRRPIISVPVYVTNCNGNRDYDAWDYSEILRKLEDAWNEQEPEPEWALFLKPAAKPRAERQS